MGIKDKIKNAEETMWPLTINDVELWAEQNNFIIVTDEWWKNAQDIICKYQKIEQILKEPCIIPEGCYPMLRKIKRVVEDGME